MGVTLTNYKNYVIVTSYNRERKEYVSTIINPDGDYVEYQGYVFRAYNMSFDISCETAKSIIGFIGYM